MSKGAKQVRELLRTEDAQLRKLNDLVAAALEEDKLITGQVFQREEAFTFGQRLADKVADFGGSWHFIIFFFSVLLGWILLNVTLLRQRPFDPYPFILLNLVLSCLAAIQAPVIMMSQNRKDTKDRRRAEEDYLVNLKSEIQLRHLHQKVDLLMTEQMKSIIEIQRIQVDMLEKINRKVSSRGKSTPPGNDA